MLSRVRKWGLVGLSLLALLTLLKLAGEAIFEQEIQKWWEGELKPLLLSPIKVQFDVQCWIILIGMALLIAGLGGGVYLFANWRTRQSGILSDVPEFPKDIDSTGLTSTDVINAIVDARMGKITPTFLINEIVIKAVNSGVIKPQAAAEVLEEFGFDLVCLSDGSYSYIKRITNEIAEKEA